MSMQTYSDEYIEYYADLYRQYDFKCHLNHRGIRFEAFLANPEYLMKKMDEIHGVMILIDKHELAIDKLPGGGVRYGTFVQDMKHHCYKKSRNRNWRVQA